MEMKLDDSVMMTGPYRKGKKESPAARQLEHEGRAKHAPDSDFDAKELALGIKTEREHTDDDDVAREIAKDHLKEDPHYYSKVLIPAEKKRERVRKSHEEGDMNPMDLLSKSSALIQPTATPKPGAAPSAPNKAPRKKRGKQHKVGGSIRSKIGNPGPDGKPLGSKKGCLPKASMGLKSLMPRTLAVLQKGYR
jgi:hypothetical protein